MINNVTLIGRMTRDIEITNFQNNQKGTFSLAVNRNYKNQNGDTEADFIDCEVWGKPAELMGKYTAKGVMIGVTGELRVNTWKDDSGNNRKKVYVNVNQVQFLEKANNVGSQQANNFQTQGQAFVPHQENNWQTKGVQQFEQSQEIEGFGAQMAQTAPITDDELPFI